MRYTDEDIEFAGRILTHREELEDEFVEKWMEDREHVRLLDELAAVRKNLSAGDFERLENGELARLEQSVADRKSRRMTLRWSVAASIVLIVALYVGRGVDEWRNLNEERLMAQTERTLPGVRAELILATGEKVQLGQKSEIISGKKETGIRNDSLTGLDYATAKMQNNNGENESVFNTIRVPVGGFYQLTLADGTRVWLNSMTDIRYPVTFTGTSREVYLKGEAYFEVSRDTSKPFIVCLETSKVTVLGTSFNIKAYADENNIYTSLVKGAVRFTNDENRKQVELKPGMQCVWNRVSGKTEVHEVDMEQFVSWKDGRFVFELITLDAMMRQLRRWYDIDVVYQDEKVKTYEFWGTIDRNMDLNKVLAIVAQVSKVAFEVQGKTVFVSMKK
jgi:putative anti-sigma factor